MLSGREVSLWQTLGVVALYIGIAAVSLLLDRRALMVSALGYVLFTFSVLFEQYGMVRIHFAVLALSLGLALLTLSAYWRPVRARLLRAAPAAWSAWVAPVR